jgi:hypothetical protein
MPLGDVESIWVANLGRGNDIGSVVLNWVTGSLVVGGCWLLRFSGLSSHNGVPGRLPSDTSSAPATVADPLGLKWGEMRSRSSWWVLLRAESVDDLRTLSDVFTVRCLR